MAHPLGGICLLVKGHTDPRMMAHAVASLGPGLVIAPKSFDEAVNAALGPLQDLGYLFGTFAALALALAMLGVHGVLNFLTRQRAREIGLRMALGARIQDVVRSVVSEGMGMVALGLALGLGGAVMLTRGLEHWLYGISPLDPLVWLVVSGLLLLASLMACLEPALRAASVDPALVLRGE
jgi:putative ABC transport system permease protein